MMLPVIELEVIQKETVLVMMAEVTVKMRKTEMFQWNTTFSYLVKS